MKFLFQKRNVLLSASALAVAGLLATTTMNRSGDGKMVKCCNNPDMNHVCVMKTILGLDTTQEGKLISTLDRYFFFLKGQNSLFSKVT